MVQAAQLVSGRVAPCSFFRAVVATRSRNVKVPPASSRASTRERCKHVRFRTTSTNTTSSSTHSGARFGEMLLLTRAVPEEQQQYSHTFFRPLCSVSYSGAVAVARTRAGELCSKSCAAHKCSTRAFGGQSVVPWELALFLVEEVRQLCWVGFARFAQEASADGSGMMTGLGALFCCRSQTRVILLLVWSISK